MPASLDNLLHFSILCVLPHNLFLYGLFSFKLTSVSCGIQIHLATRSLRQMSILFSHSMEATHITRRFMFFNFIAFFCTYIIIMRQRVQNFYADYSLFLLFCIDKILIKHLIFFIFFFFFFVVVVVVVGGGVSITCVLSFFLFLPIFRS